MIHLLFYNHQSLAAGQAAHDNAMPPEDRELSTEQNFQIAQILEYADPADIAETVGVLLETFSGKLMTKEQQKSLAHDINDVIAKALAVII